MGPRLLGRREYSTKQVLDLIHTMALSVSCCSLSSVFLRMALSNSAYFVNLCIGLTRMSINLRRLQSFCVSHHWKDWIYRIFSLGYSTWKKVKVIQYSNLNYYISLLGNSSPFFLGFYVLFSTGLLGKSLSGNDQRGPFEF